MNRVLSSIYMSCTTGQVVGLLGRNGSGKSCLLKVVFGTMAAESKSVRIDKTALMGNYMKRKLIAYLPQEFLLPSFMMPEKAIALYNADRNRMFEHFPELTDCLKQKPCELSGGQRRLLEVLLTLYSDHPFCLLDEPFSGVMPVHVEKLKEVIGIVKMRKGIIITDHLHRHIRDVADTLYVLNHGKTFLIKNEEDLIKRGYLNSL